MSRLLSGVLRRPRWGLQIVNRHSPQKNPLPPQKKVARVFRFVSPRCLFSPLIPHVLRLIFIAPQRRLYEEKVSTTLHGV